MKSKSSSDDLDDNESIGIGVGVLLFVVLIATVGLCAFLKRRKKKSQENTAKSGSQLDQPPAEVHAVEGEPVSASGGSKVAVAKSPSRSASKASAVPPNSPGGGSGS